MRKLVLVLLPTLAVLAGCASKSKVDHAKLEQYRHCYHHNPKIANACIEKNDKGERVTAMELENAAFPGQYK